MHATSPSREGKFDVEDYTLSTWWTSCAIWVSDTARYRHLPARAADPCCHRVSGRAEDPDAQPRSLTLIGGPIDPDATPTDVTDFGRRVTMGQLEETMIQRVGFKYKGVGRMVYPGLLQLASFMSMNGDRHSKAFQSTRLAA